MDEFDPQSDLSSSGVSWSIETKLFVGVLMLAVLGGAAWIFLDIPRWWRGTTDIFGNYTYMEEMEEKRESMGPMEKVHAELFPHWLVVWARPGGATSADARETYQKMREAIEDESLLEILADFRTTMQGGGLLRKGERVSELTDRWNGRLTELEEPFLARLKVHTSRGRAFIFGGFYRRLATPAATVGEEEHPAMLLKRVDSTNLWEAYLGAARNDGRYTFVITDRVMDFAIDDVLPVLADREDDKEELDRYSKAFAEPVREEIRAGLSDAAFRRLKAAARKRRDIEQAVDSIRGRRECGSRFRIANPRWNGYAPPTLDTLVKYADRDRLKPCPTVNYDELDTIIAGSLYLQDAATEEAMEALVAFLSRTTTVHEVRHRADNAAWRERKAEEEQEAAREAAEQEKSGARGVPVHYSGPPCPGCESKMRGSARAELSAYTASFAWSAGPATALFQACKAKLRGSHRRALAMFLEELDGYCDRTPPEDLQEQARKIETFFFGRQEAVELPEGFAERVDIESW